MKPQRQSKGGRRRPREFKPKDEFDHQMIDLTRVTRVTKGGKQLSFRATVVVGDRKGRVGEGTAKGKDVQIAIEKARTKAKKNVFHVNRAGDTIPHAVQSKFKAAKVLLKPAPHGSGLISGGPVRIVLDLAGIDSASSKILGSNNKVNITRATIVALKMLKKPRTKKKEDVKEEDLKSLKHESIKA